MSYGTQFHFLIFAHNQRCLVILGICVLDNTEQHIENSSYIYGTLSDQVRKIPLAGVSPKPCTGLLPNLQI